MKKLLSFAMIVATGVLFAQNTETTTQVGNNTSSVTQLGSTNNSVVNQNGQNNTFGGDMNLATVNQVGGALGANTSYIDQQGDRNNGAVTQTGSLNDAYQSVGVGYAEDNNAVATQTGYDNKSTQIQRWDNNSAFVNQNSALTSGGNVAKQDQRSMANGAPGSFAVIDQLGSNHWAFQRQRGSLNISMTTQSGDNHWARSRQKSRANTTLSNASIINQDGMYGRHKADVKQTSRADFAANISSVTQADLATLGGSEAYVTQDARGTSANSTSLTQFGDNLATYTQASSGLGTINVATGMQTGTNVGTVNQTVTGFITGNESTLNQMGANTATITQDASGSFTGNTSTVLQTGTNTATVIQSAN